MSAWYKIKKSYDDDEYCGYDSYTYAKTVYNDGMNYEKLERYDTFFKTIEDCQSYCNYLNENKID